MNFYPLKTCNHFKICENKENTLNDEYSKITQITAEHKQTVKQLETLMALHEQQKLGYEEVWIFFSKNSRFTKKLYLWKYLIKQIDQYKKEIYEMKLKLEDSHQEYYHERKNTMYDESYYLNQIAQLESENKLFKSEMEKLNANIEELDANLKIYKTNIQDDDDDDAVFRNGGFMGHAIPASISQESFLSEINSSQDNEVRKAYNLKTFKSLRAATLKKYIKRYITTFTDIPKLNPL